MTKPVEATEVWAVMCREEQWDYAKDWIQVICVDQLTAEQCCAKLVADDTKDKYEYYIEEHDIYG